MFLRIVGALLMGIASGADYSEDIPPAPSRNTNSAVHYHFYDYGYYYYDTYIPIFVTCGLFDDDSLNFWYYGFYPSDGAPSPSPSPPTPTTTTTTTPCDGPANTEIHCQVQDGELMCLTVYEKEPNTFDLEFQKFDGSDGQYWQHKSDGSMVSFKKTSKNRELCLDGIHSSGALILKVSVKSESYYSCSIYDEGEKRGRWLVKNGGFSFDDFCVATSKDTQIRSPFPLGLCTDGLCTKALISSSYSCKSWQRQSCSRHTEKRADVTAFTNSVKLASGERCLTVVQATDFNVDEPDHLGFEECREGSGALHLGTGNTTQSGSQRWKIKDGHIVSATTDVYGKHPCIGWFQDDVLEDCAGSDGRRRARRLAGSDGRRRTSSKSYLDLSWDKNNCVSDLYRDGDDFWVLDVGPDYVCVAKNQKDQHHVYTASCGQDVSCKDAACQDGWSRSEPTPTPPSPSPAPSPPYPGDEACHACFTMCVPCQACVDSQDGECEKCWQCWDWDDDKLEDDDDDMDEECDALHKDHDWDDAEVRCLAKGPKDFARRLAGSDGRRRTPSNSVVDCRACWTHDLVERQAV